MEVVAKIPITLRLVDRSTGIIKDVPDTWHQYDDPEYKEFNDCHWTEGNMSCDCNRGLCFYPEEESDFPCGDVRFDLLSITEDGTGKVLWPTR
jgi:hypothetical protein